MNLLLEIIFRFMYIDLLLCLLLLLAEILAADNLFGRSFRKWNVTQMETGNLLIGRKSFIVLFNDLSHCFLNVVNTCSVCILKVWINLRCDHVIFPIYQDILDQAVVYKQVLQLLRRYIFTVA